MNETELFDALDRLVEPLPAPAPLTAGTVGRGARRRQAKLAGGGCLAAAAVAGVALLVLPPAGPDRVVPAQRPTTPLTAPPTSAPTGPGPSEPAPSGPAPSQPAPPSTSSSDRPVVEAPPQLDPEPEPTTDPTAATVVLQGDGLGLLTSGGSNRMQLFGAADPQVLDAALEQALGPGTPGPQADCGPTMSSVSYPGFQVLLERGRFVGWFLGDAGPDLATADGITTGSTLADLRASFGSLQVDRTSLGVEWSTGGLAGLLDGTAEDSRVTDVWAGQTCIAR